MWWMYSNMGCRFYHLMENWILYGNLNIVGFLTNRRDQMWGKLRNITNVDKITDK